MTINSPVADVVVRAIDTASLLLALATLAQILPALAAALSCIWYAIRIYEWIAKKRRRSGTHDPSSESINVD